MAVLGRIAADTGHKVLWESWAKVAMPRCPAPSTPPPGRVKLVLPGEIDGQPFRGQQFCRNRQYRRMAFGAILQVEVGALPERRYPMLSLKTYAFYGRTRRGFTLVELLVVIAIIGILVGMLLPAVQTARESARNSTCTNNFKQFGVALHQHHDAKKTFPGGYNTAIASTWSSGGTGAASWGWAAKLLPYMENTSLFNTLGVDTQELSVALNSANATAIRTATKTVLPFHICPSDQPTNGTVATQWLQTWFVYPAISNYVACVGRDTDGSYYWKAAEADGAFPSLAGLALHKITDGSSKTFAIGERASVHGAGCWAGPQYVGGFTWQDASHQVMGTVGMRLNAPAATNYNASGFSSYHPGGANFLFCDGRVRFISETIDYNLVYSDGDYRNWSGFTAANQALIGIYQRLGMRNDSLQLGDY